MSNYFIKVGNVFNSVLTVYESLLIQHRIGIRMTILALLGCRREPYHAARHMTSREVIHNEVHCNCIYYVTSVMVNSTLL